MRVKLISITQSLVEGIKLSAEELIVYIARVSNPSNQMNTETSDRLLGYLLRNKHLSPFEQAHMTVEVVTSRAISAQILRHWSMRFQEFSTRYAEVTEMEPIQLRKAGSSNRQSSTEVFDPYVEVDYFDEATNGAYYPSAALASELIAGALGYVQALYRGLLQADVAKECARMILPLTSQTTIYLTGNVRDWIFYLKQRTDPHAQLEHQQVALAIKALFEEQFPMISKYLRENADEG